MLKVSLPTNSVLPRAQIERMVSEFEPGNGGGVAAWNATKPLPLSDTIAGVKGLEGESLEAQEERPAVEEEPVCNKYVEDFIRDVENTVQLVVGYFEKYLESRPDNLRWTEEKELIAVLHFLSALNERADKILGRL